jgi:2-dehydropantoate 2-reductase
LFVGAFLFFLSSFFHQTNKHSYGARLFEAGHDVQFYMRSPHYETCRRDGLRVTSVHGKVEICSQDLKVFRQTSDMDAADWIVISLKSSSLQAAIPTLIVPSLLKADNSTRILVIMNGLVEDDLIHLMKQATGQIMDNNDTDATDNDKNEPLHRCRALYGGMALICCNRLCPGHVDHSYAGLLSAGVACSNGSSNDEDRLAFENLWSSNTKQDIAWESCLLRGRWKKMLWNLPFNGISVAMGGITVDKIVQDESLRQLAMNIMDETIAAANAEMLHRHGPGRYEPLTLEDKEQMMVFTDKMGPYRTSTMLDLVNRQTMEVEYLFGKPVERAERLGVPVPHLKTILAMIQAYQRFYNLF